MKTFTQEDKNKLDSLVLNAIYNGVTFETTMGTEVSVWDLLHSLSIGSLRIMLNRYKQKSSSMCSDDWSEDMPELTSICNKIDLIYLVIGYRIDLQRKLALEEEKSKLRKALEEAIDAAKTPEDKIQEIRAQIQALDK